MITHLSIRNYVLIRELEIRFHSGLSIITGETGAGKSILLGALGLLTGLRADSNTLLDPSKKCIVEGTFKIPEEWKDFFAARDLDYEPETIVRREISSDGKSRAFINDSPVNLSVLKELVSQFVDIHSQHHNIYLQSSAFQLQILDTYAQQSDVVADYGREYTRFRKLTAEWENLQAIASRSQSELDYHRFRFEELEAAKLAEDEQEELENELKILTHAGDIKSALTQVNTFLDADEVSVVQMLKSASAVLSRIQDLYSPAKDFFLRLESSLIELRDVAGETGKAAEQMEIDPSRLEEVNARLDLLYSLQQKHRVSTIKELIDIRNDLDEKIREINDYGFQLENLQKQMDASREQLTTVASSLSENRRKTMPAIEGRIKELLAQLGISNALFKVELTPSGQLTATGQDSVRFLFSANRQQNFQELGKVASGGEMSRLMLSIKAAIAEKIALPTLIFDEIDSGVSGEIAVKMGNILRQMSRYAQIINITHLPQIAAKGEHHYKVYKEDNGHTTQTQVRELTPDERIMEIAKMLSGEKITDAAIENARNLLGNK